MLPNNCKIGGTLTNIRKHGDRYLTEDHVMYVYKKVNASKEINTMTIKQEVEQEKSTKAEIDDNCNTYQKAIMNDVNMKGKVSTQMEDWSILSDHVKYVKHDDGLETFHKLNVHIINYCQYKDLYQQLKEKKILTVDVDFGNNPEKLKSEYLDVYEGVYAEIVCTNRFDEDSNLSTTYLGQVNITRNAGVRAVERFPITA